MANHDKRVTDLEEAKTIGGLAVIHEGQPMATISQPENREHEKITVEDFKAEFPGGTLITVVRRSAGQPSRGYKP